MVLERAKHDYHNTENASIMCPSVQLGYVQCCDSGPFDILFLYLDK